LFVPAPNPRHAPSPERSSRPRRVARGYEGWNHETLGSDLIATFAAVNAVDPRFSEHWMPLVKTLDAQTWYPIDVLLALGFAAEERFGPELLQCIGREIFQRSHAATFRRSAATIADLAFGIDAMYRTANRGEDIGGWRVLEFADGRTLIEKTTPHPCGIEEGILGAACASLGVAARITQVRCVREGDDTCRFELCAETPSTRWGVAP
jgi:hypothetical protein